MLRSAQGIIAMSLEATVQGLTPLGQALRAAGALSGSACPAAGLPRHISSGTAAAGRYQEASRGMLDDMVTTAPPRSGSTVVLVNGGFEAAALLSYWRYWDHGQQLLPLFVDYGQRSALAEERAQLAMCRHLGLGFNAVNASMLAHQVNMSAAGKRYHDPLPHRDLLLLSLAANFAADTQASNVAVCLTKDDLGHNNTSTMPFLRHVEALYESLTPPLTLLMPLVGLAKHQVVSMGDQVKAPWRLSYSCAEGGDAPCGRCGACRAREEAFDRADLKDPLMECPLPGSGADL